MVPTRYQQSVHAVKFVRPLSALSGSEQRSYAACMQSLALELLFTAAPGAMARPAQLRRSDLPSYFSMWKW